MHGPTAGMMTNEIVHGEMGVTTLPGMVFLPARTIAQEVSWRRRSRTAKSRFRTDARFNRYWVSRLVFVAAKLGLADLLKDRPKTAPSLARQPAWTPTPFGECCGRWPASVSSTRFRCGSWTTARRAMCGGRILIVTRHPPRERPALGKLLDINMRPHRRT